MGPPEDEFWQRPLPPGDQPGKQKAEEFNRQLEAVYKQRIAELEAEVQMYQSFENIIHSIAARHLEKQPGEI